MKALSIPARIYVVVTIAVGGLVIAQQLADLGVADNWLLITACALGALFQVFKVEGATTRTSYNLAWIVYGFTFVLMDVPATIVVVVVAHVAEWLRHRYSWYIQSFNIASFGLAFFLAGLLHDQASMLANPDHMSSTLTILGAMALFTLLNHVAVGIVIWLARGQNFKQSGVFGTLTLMLDFGLLCLGAVAAMLWTVEPFAITLVAIMAYLLQSVLKVPALQRQTTIEPKTGLFNARYFSDELRSELERAQRFGRPLTVVMADLDLLRVVNNSYGHLAGDIVLKGVADLLQKLSRDYDTVSRFGGEEFAVLMPETTAAQAYERIEMIRQAIADAEFSVATSIKPIKVTMSFGIAERHGRTQSLEELVHCADLAVYEAKRTGRNRVCLYGDGASASSNAPNLPSSSVAAPQKPAAVQPHVQHGQPPATSERSPSEPVPVTRSKPGRTNPLWLTNLFIGIVMMLAITLSVLLVRPSAPVDWTGVVLFALLIIVVETLSIDIYVRDTSVSTSAAPLLAGALLFGPVGALVMGSAVATASLVRHRSPAVRFAFNASNHSISGLLVSSLVLLAGGSFASWSLTMQGAVTLIGAGLIYFSSTGLVAIAMGLSNNNSIRAIWMEHFRWLAAYYAALGVVAFALMHSYVIAGPAGIVSVLLPLLVLRLAQKQYIDHTGDMVRQLRATNTELLRQSEEITMLNEEMLLTLARSIDLRDPHVMEHSQHVARYAQLIAKEMGLPADRVACIHKAGLLHDVGKLGIPESILFKPAELTPQEYELVKEHVVIGADLLESCHSLHELRPFILYHHEYYDGTGYMAGLKGEEIPLEARILSVADAVEAMASDRPYQVGQSTAAILEEVERCAGTQFDPEVVAAFQRVVAKHGHDVIVNSARYIQPTIYATRAEELLAMPVH